MRQYIARTISSRVPGSARASMRSAAARAVATSSVAPAPAADVAQPATPSAQAIAPSKAFNGASLELPPLDLERLTINEKMPELPETVQRAPWHPLAQRVGLLGYKVGMVSYFLPSGERVPCTVVHCLNNEVIRTRWFNPARFKPKTRFTNQPRPSYARSRRPYLGLMVYAGNVPFADLPLRKQRKLKGRVRCFRVSRDGLVPKGTKLSVLQFVPGQKVDVIGKSKGKGFQGVVKRWGFAGGPATHGTSLWHRRPGSIGASATPSRVFPQKKMPGNMGNKKHTVHNVRVLRVDTQQNLIYLLGQIPGPKRGLIRLQDAIRDLQWYAHGQFIRGQLADGTLATGNESAASFLPKGVNGLPFPCVTKDMEDRYPKIVEVKKLL